MPGQILRVVADLIVSGLRDTEAREIVERADLSWLGRGEEAVPLGPYRDLVARVLDRHGPSPILRAGLGLKDVSHHLLFVLLNTDRPELLIRKEKRLGHFIHSRRGVRIVSSKGNELILEHFSKTDAPVHPTEGLASCGQHLAMLEMIGARGLTLRFPRCGDPTQVFYGEGSAASSSVRDGFDLWHFTWDGLQPAHRPMVGLDDVLIDRARLKEIEALPGITAAVERIVQQDLGRTWSLESVAHELHLSTRTLQRRLSPPEPTFSDLILDIRCREARRLLGETDLSQTAIGFACGFTDASHFNRTFRRRIGLNPGAWRRQERAS